MNVEIETDAAQFPEKEYINGFFIAVWVIVWWQLFIWISPKGRRGE